MISTLDLQTLFDRILQVLREVTHCDSAALLLYNPGAEELEVHQALGTGSDALRGSCLRLEEGVTGQAARNQELIYVQDIGSDGRYLHYKKKTPQRGSMVSAPLTSKKRLLGVLNLHKDRCAAFTDGEIKLIQTVVTQAAIAIENAQLYEKTRNLSNTDELTGLANRRHFQEIVNREVAQARRYGTGFSLIIIDIDFFKLYNDTHGHLRGDAVLRKVAALLLQNTRGIDLVARFGGEEFVVLLPKTGTEGARAAAEKLRQCVAAETFSGAERSQPGGRLTISLGVAEFPSNSRDIYELIDLADRALYQAKQKGRNRTVVWDDLLSQQLAEGTYPPGTTSP
jgi:diguanylate cyclase (GGDEF)-like protein